MNFDPKYRRVRDELLVLLAVRLVRGNPETNITSKEHAV